MRSRRSLKVSHTQTSVPCGTLKNVDRQTDGQKIGQKTDKRTGKRTNKQTELHQFRKEPSYDGDLCPCQV